MKIERTNLLSSRGIQGLRIPSVEENQETRPGAINLRARRLGATMQNGFVYPVGPHQRFDFSQNSAGSGNTTVPEGITSITISMSGGAGGRGRPYRSNPDWIQNRRSGGSGGTGALQSIEIPVTPGDVIEFDIGDQGRNGTIGIGGLTATDGSPSYVYLNGVLVAQADGGSRGGNARQGSHGSPGANAKPEGGSSSTGYITIEGRVDPTFRPGDSTS